MPLPLRVAVVSDMHCHGRGDCEGRRESHLIANDPRVPGERHPVQSLLDLLEAESLTADVLLCPGDLAHKASPDGLSQSWAHLREIAQELSTSHLICTLGNHDVASRARHGDPFDIAKHVHPLFPIADSSANDQFWAQGFCLQRLTSDADIVVINTAYHHYDELEAKHGTFPDAQLHHLDHFLRANTAPALRLALLHHHPVLHSFAGFGSSDVLPNGDALLAILAANGSRLVIHGHKHHPRLRREMLGGDSVFVFAAGSLSAYLLEIGTRTRNLFHIVEVNSITGGLQGSVRSWEFNYARGWNPTSVSSSEFPHIANFGPQAGPNLPARVADHLAATDSRYIDATTLSAAFPELTGLLPDELHQFALQLRTGRDLKADIGGAGVLEGISHTRSSSHS